MIISKLNMEALELESSSSLWEENALPKHHVWEGRKKKKKKKVKTRWKLYVLQGRKKGQT